jgi:ABC-type nitrate/sulfonate/bicarbonate transport system substrate-binding protein
MLKLAVPDLVSNSYFPAEAAIELGLFAKEGLDVSLELIFPVDKAYRAMRDGEVDIVAGSAHSALAAFPRFEGAKLLCAQSQGMYWFLVLRADLKPEKGDLSAVKGRRIGAAPWVDMGLRQILVEEGIDIQRDDVTIMPVPSPPGRTVNFGLNAAQALEQGLIDGFWANGMAAEIAVRSGVGSVVLDTRRGDGPATSFDYTFASIATRSSFIEEHRERAAAIVIAVVAAQKALKENVARALEVGRKLFPGAQAELITDIVKRDLPFYDAAISRKSVAGLSSFARKCSLIDTDLASEDVVATDLENLWR